MERFTWTPRRNARGTVRFNTLRAQFGDGYEQVAQDGINSRQEEWPLEFFGAESEISPIRVFLDRHGSWQSFLWTPPGGTESAYRLSNEGYSLLAQGGGWYTVSATFKQVFKP